MLRLEKNRPTLPIPRPIGKQTALRRERRRIWGGTIGRPNVRISYPQAGYQASRR